MTLEFTPHLPLTPSAVPGPYRVADYMSYEGEERVELIHGRLYVVPAPALRHQITVGEIFLLLKTVAKATKGLAANAPTDVILAEHSVVQPDVLFISNENRSVIQEGRIRGAPDLLVEVLSPSSILRDRTAKAKLYADCGVREHWIVDPESRQMDFFILDGVTHRRVHAIDGVYTSPTCPEITLKIPEMWEQIEEELDPQGS